MLTYQAAKKKFDRAKDPAKGVKLASATTLHWTPKEAGAPAQFRVKFHDTDIVTIREDGSYTVTTGGYFTMITRQRIEEYSPVRFEVDKGLWSYKGMVFDGKLNWASENRWGVHGGLLEREKAQKINTKFVREVRDFANRTAQKFIDKALPDPAGDCFICRAMQPIGSGKRDLSGCGHLWAHLAERYHQRQLLWVAILERRTVSNGYFSKPHTEEEVREQARNDMGYSQILSNTRLPANAISMFFRRRRQQMIFFYDEQEFQKTRKEVTEET